jgi:hypothetical protein
MGLCQRLSESALSIPLAGTTLLHHAFCWPLSLLCSAAQSVKDGRGLAHAI